MLNIYEKKSYTAITTRIRGGLAREITSPVKVRVPLIIKDASHNLIETLAIWDTGATNTVIAESLCDELGLIPISKTNVRGVIASGIRDVYLIDMIIGNNVEIKNLRVTTGNISPEDNKFGVLIGMDIISFGDFSLTAEPDEDGILSTVFSFRVPHGPKAVDYVEEINRFKREKDFHEKMKKNRTQPKVKSSKKKRKGDEWVA